jgi:hypothetical protein
MFSEEVIGDHVRRPHLQYVVHAEREPVSEVHHALRGEIHRPAVDGSLERARRLLVAQDERIEIRVPEDVYCPERSEALQLLQWRDWLVSQPLEKLVMTQALLPLSEDVREPRL